MKSCLKEELEKRINCVSRDSKVFQQKHESNFLGGLEPGMCYGPNDRIIPCSKIDKVPLKCIPSPFGHCRPIYLDENGGRGKLKGHYDSKGNWIVEGELEVDLW